MPDTGPHTCTGPECDRPVIAKGLCPSHYHQQRRGRPLTPLGTTPRGHWPKGKPRKPKGKRG